MEGRIGDHDSKKDRTSLSYGILAAPPNGKGDGVFRIRSLKTEFTPTTTSSAASQDAELHTI